MTSFADFSAIYVNDYALSDLSASWIATTGNINALIGDFDNGNENSSEDYNNAEAQHMTLLQLLSVCPRLNQNDQALPIPNIGIDILPGPARNTTTTTATTTNSVQAAAPNPRYPGGPKIFSAQVHLLTNASGNVIKPTETKKPEYKGIIIDLDSNSEEEADKGKKVTENPNNNNNDDHDDDDDDDDDLKTILNKRNINSRKAAIRCNEKLEFGRISMSASRSAYNNTKNHTETTTTITTTTKRKTICEPNFTNKKKSVSRKSNSRSSTGSLEGVAAPPKVLPPAPTPGYCCVCLESLATCAPIGCFHKNYCLTCIPQLNPAVCALCKMPFTEFARIFE
jgi:hypothetical protein